MKDSQRLRGPRISIVAGGLLACMLLGSWTNVAFCAGRNLVAEGQTVLMPASFLRPAVVRLAELDDATGRLVLNGQVFQDSGSLLAYLSNQPSSSFRDGILLVYTGKEAVARDFYDGVVGFCVSNDFDLFSSVRASKPGLENQVVWVVQSSVSPYPPPPPPPSP